MEHMAREPKESVSPEKDRVNAEASKTTLEPHAQPDEFAPTTPGQRDEVASRVIERFALWSGVAGLVPIPLVDVVAVGGLQIQMLRRLSQIYGVPFSENRSKALVAGLAGSLIPAASGIGAVSMLKTVPIAGTIAAAVVMPSLSAAATYAIGKAFVQHFASGGTLLDFNPPDYRDFVKAQMELWRDSRSKTAGRDAPRAETPSGP
jgi:uncharacterized protein (DUF697 family)